MTQRLHNTLEVMFDHAQPMDVRYEGGAMDLLRPVYDGISSRSSANPAYSAADTHAGGVELTDFATGYIFTNPDSRGLVVKMRRQLVQEFGFVGQSPQTQHVFEDALAFAQGHVDLLKREYDPVWSTDETVVFTPVIEMYLRDRAQRDERGNYIDDGSAVWQLPSKLDRSRQACSDFSAEHGKSLVLTGHFVDSVGATLDELGGEFDVQAYLRAKGSPHEQGAVLDVLATDVRMTRTTEAIQQKVGALGLNPTTSTGNDEPILFRDLRHAKFRSETQEPNTLELTDKPIALVGRNGSGKTHLLESIGLLWLSHGSVGHAAAVEARIPEAAGMSSLFRPQGGNEHLSAFGSEAKQWGEVLSWLEQLPEGKCKLVLGDEPFASTDYKEQAIIIRKLIGRLQELGAQLVMTSHSEMGDMAEEGMVAPYHFERVGDRRHVLVEGVADSEAFDEAREQGMPEDIVARAEELAEGANFDIGEVVSQELTPRPSVRERYGTINPGMGWFIPRMPMALYRKRHEERRSFGDPKVERRREWHALARGAAQADPCNVELSSDILPGWNGIFGKMITEGSTNNLHDLLARQDFFDRMADYEKSGQLSAELTDFMYLYHGLSADGWRNRHSGYGAGHRLSSLFTNIYADYGLGLANVLGSIFGHQWNDSMRRGPDALPPYKERAEYLLATLTVIDDVLGEHMPDDILAVVQEYSQTIAWLESLRDTQTKRGNVAISKSDRERLYESAAKLLKVWEPRHYKPSYHGKRDEQGRSTTLRRVLGRLNNVFYDYEDDDNFRRTWTKPYKKVNFNDLQKIVYGDGSYGNEDFSGLITMLVAKAVPILSLDDLTAEHHESISALYRACRAAEDAGVRTPPINALAVLDHLTSNEDSLGSIRDHLLAAGGEIAESLADYFDKDIRKQMDGTISGIELKTLITKRAGKVPLPKSEKHESKYQRRSRRSYYYAKAARLRARDVITHSDGMSGKIPVTPHSEANMLIDLISTARSIRHNRKLSPVTYGDHPITLRKMRNPVRPAKVSSNVGYASVGGIDVISGSNMSGKTTFGQALFAAVASSQGTGFTRAKNPQLPVYDKVISIGRPKHDSGKGLSSFGVDVDNWKKAFEMLDTAAPSFVFVDEPFSTTSSKYGEAFILSAVEWLAKRGHKVVLATHDHSAIARIRAAREKSPVEIAFHNLHSELDESGDVNFSYKLVEGEAPSWAIAVAKKIGGPALAAIFD